MRLSSHWKMMLVCVSVKPVTIASSKITERPGRKRTSKRKLKTKVKRMDSGWKL